MQLTVDFIVQSVDDGTTADQIIEANAEQYGRRNPPARVSLG